MKSKMKKKAKGFAIREWDNETTADKLYGEGNWHQQGEIGIVRFVIHKQGLDFFNYNPRRQKWEQVAYVNTLTQLLQPYLQAPVGFFVDKTKQG